jgi:hypothetical protein
VKTGKAISNYPLNELFRGLPKVIWKNEKTGDMKGFAGITP